MASYAQRGEDKVIDQYLAHIGAPDRLTVVDIGAGDGYRYSNTRHLIERGAKALLLDLDGGGNPEVTEVLVTAENIPDLLRGWELPDFLSIDIDGNDYWVLRAALTKCMPRLIMAEINTQFDSADVRMVVPYEPDRRWNDDDHYGMSFGAFKALMEEHNYTVVWMDGINALAMHNIEMSASTPIHLNYRQIHGHKHNAAAPWIQV
jgi:hypothetical protein